MALLSCAVAIAFLVPSPGHAQDGETLIRVDAPAEAIDVGETFEVQVVVEDVEHLAAFVFDLQYDPERIEPVEEGEANGEISAAEATEGDATPPPLRVEGGDVGLILTTSERNENILCEGPVAVDDDEDGVRETVRVSCVTAGPPVCLDGPEGASGSGVLATVLLEAAKAGETELRLSDSTLTLDDLEGCDPDFGTTIQIEHGRENATVELVGDDFPWLVVGIVVGVVVVVLAGGLGALAWYRRRSAGAEP